MGNYIKVNTAALSRDANDLRQLSQQASRQIKTMNSDMLALGAMWDGPAKSTFLQQFNIDVELFNEICKNVSLFADDLQKAAKEYDRCENSVFDAVKAIRV